MSIVQLRNVITGEITPVDNGSDEYRELRDEKYDHGAAIRPLYEITSAPAVDRINNDPQEADFGYENKPVQSKGAVDPGQIVFGQRHKQLTPAETKHGLKDYEQKRSEADDMQANWPGQPEVINKTPIADRAKVGADKAGNVTSLSGDHPGRGEGEGDSESGKASSGSQGGSGSGSGAAKPPAGSGSGS
jgi:hypothetical protein